MNDAVAPEQNKPQPSIQEWIGDKLSGNALVPVIFIGSAVIGLAVALMLWASSPPYRALYNNISEVDGGSIIAELEKRGVPYELGAQGSSIMVPSDMVHKLRLQLAEQGLPETGNVGFDLIDEQRFGISQFTEQVNFQRAMEGELSRSIESLAPIKSARVHLALAKATVFVRERKVSKASVIVTLHPGRDLSSSQSAAIAHMVSSSIPELATADVSIVDQRGQLLSNSDQAGTEVSIKQLAYTENVERIYEQRVEAILQPIFGSANVQVKVAASIDFSRHEETAEQFRPNQAQEQGAIRSSQMSSRSTDGMAANIGGIPGALSNTPPGWAPSPITNPDAPAAPEAAGGKEGGEVDYANTINYEVDRSVTHTKRQPGTVERLNAAVVVNYRSSVNEEGEVIQSPLSDEEMLEIEALIKQALGFSDLRGDQVSLMNTLFASGPKEEAVPWYLEPQILKLIEDFMRYFFAGLGILLLHLIFLRPALRRWRESKVIAAKAFPTPIAGGNGSTTVTKTTTDANGKKIVVEEETLTNDGSPYAKAYETALSEVKGMATEDPQLVALTVRSWVGKDK